MTVSAPLVHHEHPARWAQDAPLLPLPRPRTDGDIPTGSAVVYGSFSCPWSYLASQRADRIADPALRPTWRMIDPDDAPGTRLAAPGSRDSVATDHLAAELEAVRACLLPGECLPDRPPAFVPHTGPAVVGYAEAVGAGVADEVRRQLFDAYWQEGLDIGVPEVLRRLLRNALCAGTSRVRSISEHGYAVTLTGGPITSDAHRRVAAWHRARLASSAGGLPALTTHTTTTFGEAALSMLATGLSPHAEFSRIAHDGGE